MSAEYRRNSLDPRDLDDLPPDPAADEALREALFAIEMPAPSPGFDAAAFDARVLEAVRGRSVWREAFLCYLRPALATASASAVVTLLLVNVTTRPPKPAHASVRPLSVRDERAGVETMRRALESDTPTYAALQSLRESARPRAADGGRAERTPLPGAGKPGKPGGAED